MWKHPLCASRGVDDGGDLGLGVRALMMGWDGIEQWMGAWVSCRVRSSEMQAL